MKNGSGNDVSSPDLPAVSELHMNGIQLISYWSLGTNTATLESEGRISDFHQKKRLSKGRLEVGPCAPSFKALPTLRF